jgi:hypothetical protein
MIVWPACEYALDERLFMMPALEISLAWRAAALPVGIVLMCLFATRRLLRDASLRHAAAATLIVAAIIAAFWMAQPLSADLGRLNLLIFFVGMVAASPAAKFERDVLCCTKTAAGTAVAGEEQP